MANNYFCITGKLTKFEIRKAGSEHKIAELTIAAYNGADADCPVYVQAKQWNPTAKTKKMLKQVLENEGRVQATGRARMDTWENDDDERQFKLYLLADDRDGVLEADEIEDDDEGGYKKGGGKKSKGKKGGGGKKKRGKKNIQKKKGKGKKKRRDEEDDEDEDEDDEEDGDDDDEDDDWDEDD